MNLKNCKKKKVHFIKPFIKKKEKRKKSQENIKSIAFSSFSKGGLPRVGIAHNGK